MTTVVVAPQGFKGTIGPGTVARALAAGVRRVWPDATLIELPVSDGGDGLLDAVLRAGARRVRFPVTGPLGRPVEGELGWLDEQTAIFESASACGLRLVPPALRDPTKTTTRGVAELLLGAVARGARRIYVGLGGSATVDGGTGMARGLGWQFLDAESRHLAEGGGSLERLSMVVPGSVPRAGVVGLADVENPLTGLDGAARTFAPQKGADAQSVSQLERGLARVAAWANGAGKGAAVQEPGAGAAGGLGAGLCLFAGARLEPGARWVLERAGFGAALRRAHCVLTAEGAFDPTSWMGKATGEIVRQATAAGVKTGVVAGRADAEERVATFTPSEGEQLDAESIAALAAQAVTVLLGLPAS
jgi:glycerate kinase